MSYFRTFKFYGRGYNSATPTNITVTLDGKVIYSGEVSTLDTPDTPMWNQAVALFTAGEVPINFQGSLPLTITVNSGSLMQSEILANYSNPQNPDEFTFMDPNENDPRINPKLDGVDLVIPDPRPVEYEGTWGWGIPESGVFTCELQVTRGAIPKDAR